VPILDSNVEPHALGPEAFMTRTEMLEEAAMKLAEAVLLLAAAGERRLAADAGELAELVEFSSLPFEGKTPTPRTSH
jgi:hypothetical protein